MHSKHRIIQDDTYNARMTALWRLYAGERETRNNAGRQDGAAAGHSIANVNSC